MENCVPDVMFCRMLSLRAFDNSGMMVDAKVVEGEEIQKTICEMLCNNEVVHIDAHNAARGCFAGRVSRA